MSKEYADKYIEVFEDLMVYLHSQGYILIPREPREEVFNDMTLSLRVGKFLRDKLNEQGIRDTTLDT